MGGGIILQLQQMQLFPISQSPVNITLRIVELVRQIGDGKMTILLMQQTQEIQIYLYKLPIGILYIFVNKNIRDGGSLMPAIRM
jgi:hypothetical protein